MSIASRHAPAPTSLLSAGGSAVKHRQLIATMARRDVVGRYRGSVFGIAWSLLNPILMLLVYTFVFGVIFRARWGVTQSESRAEFALVLFVGLIVHGMIAECLNRAPGLIAQHSNYVKKLVFPLEILPIVVLVSAVFHSLISTGVLVIALLLAKGTLPAASITLPAIVGPLLLMTLGLTWAVSSLGVFVRDLTQTMGIVTAVLLFLSPVFYPLSAVPAEFRTLIQLNPLTFYIEQARGVLIWGVWPDWLMLLLHSLVAVAVAWIGYWWFQRTRKGFPDVL